MNYQLEESEGRTAEGVESIHDIDSFYSSTLTKGYKDIRNLDSNYTIDQAKEDNCFVISHTKVYHDNLYDTFMEHYQNKKSAFIRVVQPMVEGDSIILDIMYDSNHDEIILIVDNTRDKFSSDEDRTIKLLKYEKTCEYEYNDHLFWVLYNGNISDELFVTDDVYLVVTVN